GTMAMATTGPIKEVRFGFSLETLFIRIDFDRPARQALADFDLLRIGFAEPRGAELRVERPGEANAVGSFLIGARASQPVSVGIERIAEIAVPFSMLEREVQDPIAFYVE